MVAYRELKTLAHPINEFYDVDEAYHSKTNKGTGFFKPSKKVLIRL